MVKSDYLEKSKVYKGFHYSVLKPEMLAYLHQRTLEMFKEVIRIFDENRIKYMICGGTLLGGSTTQKFIPWDDDLDLCIFDEDYAKATQLLIEQLSNDTVLQCPQTDQNYYLGWIKVRDKRSHVYPDAPKFCENGVWIDIYKLVKAKMEDVAYIIAKENIDYLNRRRQVGGLTQEEYIQRIENNNLYNKLEEARAYASSLSNKTEVYIIWSASKIIINKEWIFPLQKLNFENIEVTTFHNIDAYLKRHYGDDYTQLPPDEMRRVGINHIDFF